MLRNSKYLVGFVAIISFLATAASVQADCPYDALGLKMGMTTDQAREILLGKGFRELEVGRNGFMSFTTRLPWPPEGVTLTREQQHLAVAMGDDRRHEQLLEMAESDPELKAKLEGIPPIPVRRDETDVRITGGKIADTIGMVNVIHQFAGDAPNGEYVLSDSHQLLRRSRWSSICDGMDVSGLPGQTYSASDGSRSCHLDSQQLTLRAHLQQPAVDGRRGCSYYFHSVLHQSTENLK